jgi:HAD superfamily hydrolase (TIGR01662 family)
MTAVSELLASRHNVLLDFDGPVCAVFGGAVSNVETARRLRLFLDSIAETATPPPNAGPFGMFRYAASLGQEIGDAVEAELRRIEVESVGTAPVTPGTAAVIAQLVGAGFTVAVVSNNSNDAVQHFLAQHGLSKHVRGICARSSGDPLLLKPNPHLVDKAVHMLNVSPQDCVMVGDSITDLEAAHAAGIPLIAYANKPGKYDRFHSHGADVIIEQMRELAEPLQSVAP